MRASWKMVALTGVGALVLGLAPGPKQAQACEPLHDLIRTGFGCVPDDPRPECASVLVECDQNQAICTLDAQGNVISCTPCGNDVSDKLCWASNCRSFSGDTGLFGQMQKTVKGELQAIVMVITNLTTGKVIVMKDEIDNPNPACNIPDAPPMDCSALYKIRNVRPFGFGKGPLCTWDDLDDVNTITLTPKSDGVFLNDVNGNSCQARHKPGEKYWIYYQSCCVPPDAYGQPGDLIQTDTTLYMYDDVAGCLIDTIRKDKNEPETFPSGPTTCE